MSYEGSVEYICENGHRTMTDCYAEIERCRRCGSRFKWRHSIDETNGVIVDDPGTYPAATKQVRLDDEWRVDHHGNKYAIQVTIVEPDGAAWRELS